MTLVGLIYWCPVSRSRKEMALRSVHVDARVVDLCANVQLTQRYVNNTAHPVEASYVFPLDNRAAVSGFEVEIDGVVTKADVQEKAEARQTYERAVAAGDSAQLLERVRDDVFQMSVGNLKPWSTTVVRITYVADVAIEGDGVLFFLPTFVAPRYTPIGTEHVPSGDPSAAPDGLQLDLVAAMSSDIVSMTSQTDGVAITTLEQPGNARIRTAKLANNVMSLSKDVFIKIVTKEPHAPRCLVEHDTVADTYAAVVTLAPHIDFDDEPSELIFVVDRSGSMGGYNIEQAKKALELFFRSLPEDCYINIVGFGSRFTKLWYESTKYSAESLQKASQHIATLKADLGGTEIAEPLKDVLNKPPIKGYARQVFVLTDGQVSNTDATIGIVRNAVATNTTTRVFALGLGNGASHELVEGIAEAGHGTASFCVGDDNLREKVVNQLSRAIQPALTEVAIQWVGASGQPPSYAEAGGAAPPADEAQPAPSGGLLGAFAPSGVGSLLGFSARTQAPINPADAEGFMRAPFHAPPVHTGSRFLSYCLVKKGGKPPTEVRVTAKSPAGPLDVRLPVTPADVVQGSLLHTLAARALIHDLEKGKSWMHVERSVDPGAVKKEIVRLGTQYSLASKHTSFVAVQKQSGGLQPMEMEEDIPMWRANSMAMGSAAPMRSAACCLSAAPPKMKKKGGFSLLGAIGMGGGGGGRGGRGGSRSRKASAAPALKRVDACPPPPPPCSGLDMALQGAMEAQLQAPCAALPMGDSSDEDDADMDCSLFDEEVCDKKCDMGGMRKEKEKSVKRHMKEEEKPAERPDAVLEAILKHQDFSGSFALTPALMSLIGCNVAAVKAVASKLASGNKVADVEKMLATALVIMFLRTKLAMLQTEWKLVEAKALKYVKKIAPSASLETDQAMQEATQLLAVA